MPIRFLAALTVVLALADHSWAACADTLYLKSITAYRQTSKNPNNLGTWDSVVVDPWNDSAMRALDQIRWPRRASQSITHALRIPVECASDSIGDILVARIQDTLVDSSGGKAIRVSVTRETRREKVYSEVGLYLADPRTTDTVRFAKVWNLRYGYVGLVDAAGAEPESYEVESVEIDWSNGGYFGYGGWVEGQSVLTRRLALWDLDTIFAQAKARLDSLGPAGNRSVDSVRLSLGFYRKVFSHKAPDGAVATVRRLEGRPLVRRTDAGWVVEVPSETAGSIVSVDGSQRIPLARSRRFVWTETDRSGRRVRPGVWVLRLDGMAAIPLIVVSASP